MPVIDTHAHILPQDWPDLATRFADPRFPVIDHSDGRHRMYKDGKFFREVWPNAWDPALRIAEYAQFGVDIQVLSTVPVMFCYWAEAERAQLLHRHLNTHMAEVCQAHPRAYFALATVPLQAPKLAITELEFCAQQLGLHGVQIGSHIGAWNLDAPELVDFFAACEALDMAILVHPWDMMGAESMPKYWLPWLVGMPAEQSRAACSLIFGGVLRRFPKLRIALAHGGGAFPYSIGRIEHGFRMRPDLVASDCADDPREAMRRFWFDSCVHDARALRYLIDTVGDSRVLLGTDYPFPLGEQAPGALVRAHVLDPALQNAIFYSNTMAWLGRRAQA
jgi:aminocarboxymuconate-semialdehyde decarboxylase